MTDDAADRTFVLGLDGVPWELLGSWVDDGELPNFRELTETGASGPLRSTTPPTTPLAWPSIATGVRPDKHGIYAFRRLTEAHTTEMNTSRAVEQPTLWDVLSPSVVANVPMTFPAGEMDGTMVTGMMTSSMDEGFTHPPELADRIEAEIPAYEIGLDWNEYDGWDEQFSADFSEMLAARRRLMRLLMGTEEWRLFFFVYTAPDRLQHLVWEEDVLLEHYRELDDVLGEVLSFVADSGANLFVVSDHGFGPVSRLVHVNTALQRHGYLARKEADGSRKLFESVGITKERVRQGLQAVNAEQFVHSVLPDAVVDTAAGAIPGDDVLYDVEFSETAAFMSDCGNVYVNDAERFASGAVDPDDRQRVKDEVNTLLESLTDDETGEALLDVYDGDELFPTDPGSPDLVLESAEGYALDKTLTDEVVTDSGATAGDHGPEGILYAKGPNVEEGCRISGATVYDVAPTVLQSQLRAIPEHADGRVLDVFAPGSPPEQTETTFADYRSSRTSARSGDEFDDVEERLRGLGYID